MQIEMRRAVVLHFALFITAFFVSVIISRAVNRRDVTDSDSVLLGLQRAVYTARNVLVKTLILNNNDLLDYTCIMTRALLATIVREAQ